MMADDQESPGEETVNMFRPFTRKTLDEMENRIAEEAKDNKDKPQETDDFLDPDSSLEQGEYLPFRLQQIFPSELSSKLIQDIDPYYQNKRTFVVVGKDKEIFRFSSTNALWIFNPFNPIRRVGIYTTVNPFFNAFMLTVIMLNCFIMTMPSTPILETFEIVFTSLFTIEMVIKVIALGFILKPFTYLRDPWNWLDFSVLVLLYVSIGIDLGNVGVLRAFRLLRALKSIPSLRTIGGAFFTSLKNFQDGLIVTIFSLVVFAVIGLQIYMGILTQKCIKNFPEDGSEEDWDAFNSNETNWYTDDLGDYVICGNASGAGHCPTGYTCLQGYGPNPNYGYTTFDTFGFSFITVFRVVLEDYWESLYRMVLRAAGAWHILFFVVVIFLGSYFLVNLFVATVILTFNKIEAKSKQEEELRKELENKDSKANDSSTADVSIVVTKADNAEGNGSNADNPAKVLNDAKDAVVDMKDAIPLNDVAKGKDGEHKASKSRGFHNKCIDKCCVWNCCTPWIKFRDLVGLLIFDPFMELFILICIVVNTVFMALDHHDMDIEVEKVLKTGNYFFTMVYIVEAVLKITALSPKHYFKDSWNRFDFTIVALSILEMGLEGVQGLSVLRSFRLLRVFRIAKNWPAMNSLITTMGNSMKTLGNLSCVPIIFIFIFAVTGMQLFGRSYIDNIDRYPDGDMPRWNFTDFAHSLMMVFRVLCGEWIESMWDCMLIADVSCIPFFLITAIIGHVMIMSMYLAVILSYFGTSAGIAIAPDQQASKISEAFNRISRFNDYMKTFLCSTRSLQSYESPYMNRNIEEFSEDEDGLRDCCARDCYTWFPILAGEEDSWFWESWAAFRLKACRFIENKHIQRLILLLIWASTIGLALEDVYLAERPSLKKALLYIDRVIILVYILETLVRWVGQGFKFYFTDVWCLIDFVVVSTSFANIILKIKKKPIIELFRATRSLRILRTLTFVSHWKGMKLIMATLSQAIPSVINVILVSIIFWLIFAIMGVQLFAGKFFKCVDDNMTTLSYEVVSNRNDCHEGNYTWVNSPMNFDNVANSFVCLFQIATFKGWIQIMNDAVDSRDVDRQPIREVNISMYLFFVIFIIFGTFFNFNLLTSVVISTYREQKRKIADSLTCMLSEGQRKYYNAMKKATAKKAQKAIPKPKSNLQRKMHTIVTHKKFDMVIMVFIVLMLITMTVDHYQESAKLEAILEYLNLFFILLFTLECLVKLIGLRYHYFRDLWNVYDFLVVVLSMLGLVFSDLIERYFVSPTLLRVLRIAKIGRVIRSVKSAKGIRTLLYTFAMSASDIFNIAFVLFLVTFIYAVLGMSYYKNLAENDGVDDVYNFRTFGQSVILLFQVSTTAGWDGVLGAFIEDDNCEQPNPEAGILGNCGSYTFGVLYLVSFVTICFNFIISMYIAIILENYTQATEDVLEGLTDDDYDMFFEVWEEFDQEGTQFISFDQLSDFLDALEPPLQIHKPNKYKIVSMNIPICKDDMIYCVDILDAVTKEYFARKGVHIDDFEELPDFLERPEANYEPISSTQQRQDDI